MSETVTEQVAAIVESACAADSNIFGFGIWTHHITWVAEHGRRLAPRFGADPETVELAALLHDYASVKDEALYAEHHIYGPVEAGKILRRLGVPAARVEAVQECIAGHRASVDVERRSAEAECLATVDALAHIENVPSLLYLAYVQHGLGVDEGAAWVRAKLRRSWQKVDTRLKPSARPRYRAALELLASSTDAGSSAPVSPSAKKDDDSSV